MPCASCVDDATIADRLVRVPLRCGSDGTVPFEGLGYRFSGQVLGPLVCTLERPTDVVDTATARVVLTFQALRGTGNVTVTVQTAALVMGGVPATASVPATVNIPSTGYYYLRSAHTFTAAQLFGAAGVTTTVVLVSVTAPPGDFTLISGAVEYTASR